MAYNNGKLYIAARSQFVVNGSVTKSRTYIIESDTNGNTLRIKAETNDDAYSGNGFTTTSDGGFIGVGDSAISRETVWGGIDRQVGYIVKYDSLLNKQWVLPISVVATNWATLFAVEEDNNGDFVICGTTPYSYYEHGWLIKVSKQGQLIWQRLYRAITDTVCGATNRLNALTILPDNSIVACGETNTAPLCSPIAGITQFGWLIKVDANGCMDNGFCGYTAVEEVPTTIPQVVLYPNPAHNLLHLSIAQLGEYEISFYNLMGQKIHCQQVDNEANLDLSKWESGLYFYQLQKEGKQVGSGKIMKE